MEAKTVRKGSELEIEIKAALDDAKNLTYTALQKAVDKTAKEDIAETKARSPRRTGVYAKSWTSKKMDAGIGTYGRTVYNSKKPMLTHLLENGHEIKGAAYFRKNMTRTRAFPHITSDDVTEKRLEANLAQAIEEEMGAT